MVPQTSTRQAKNKENEKMQGWADTQSGKLLKRSGGGAQGVKEKKG